MLILLTSIVLFRPTNLVFYQKLSIVNKRESSLARSAGSVSGATAVSRVLGLVREQVMAFYFGAGIATDAFIAAYRIPNILRDMFAEGALSSAFVPVFKQKIVNDSETEARSLANTVATLILLLVGLIVLLGIIAAPAIVYISANGFTSDPLKFDLTVNLTRIMMVYLLLVSLSSLAMGMLNSYGKFAIPAISPALFNLGIVLTVLICHRFFEEPVFALAIGVVVGGIAQLAIQLPALFKTGYRFYPSLNFLDEGMKRIFKLFAPMVVGLSAGRVNILVSTLLASFLAEGALSYLNYSFRIMHFPLGVFAVALGTVALPKVSELVARKDFDNLNKTFQQAIGLNFFIVIPSAVVLALVAPMIIKSIFQWGAFGEIDTSKASLALMHYSYGLVGFAVVRVVVPFYYAFGDSRLPMRVSIVTVAANLLLYYPLILVLDFAGLAAATSLAGLLNATLLLVFLSTKPIEINWGRLLLNLFRVTLAAILAFYLAKITQFNFSQIEFEALKRAAQLISILSIGGVAYFIFCLIFRVSEAVKIGKWILKIIFRKQ